MLKQTVAETCSIENCERPVKVKSRGWCNMHYQRWQKRGDPLIALHIRNGSQVCIVEGCLKASHAREWCQGHYKRWVKFGDPNATVQIRGDDETRFWLYVDKTPGFGPQGECWRWVGCKVPKGYGQIWINGKMENAHRYAFFLAYGYYPEPQGRHTCDNPGCVRFDHILAGTQLDNMRDKIERGRARNQYGPC